jgi:uncharacterized protein
MKFHQDRTIANTVSGWRSGEIVVGERVMRNSFILTAEEIVTPWSGRSVATLTLEDMAPVLALAPTIILLGTGACIDFPGAELSAAILARGIGFEVMDTPAACRTFNILVHERRPVAAALIIETPSGD